MKLSLQLMKVQTKIGAVTKSANNPHFRSKYADLNEVLDVAKEALNSEGVFIAQGCDFDSAGKFLQTSLIHGDSGESLTGKVYLVGCEENMQKMGAAITYARRFGLVSLLALESTDDDGETAVGRGGASTPSRAPATPVPTGPAKAASVVAAPAQVAPVQAAVPSGPSKETVLKKISLTSKILLDKKVMTLEEITAMLSAYAVKTKEELSPAQAGKLLSQLEERLK